MPQVNNALRRLEQGTYNENEGEILWWSYYDRVTLAAATLSHSFFTTPLGQGGKTLAMTNFPSANQMPQAQNFEVRALEMYYVPDAAKAHADIQLVLDAFATAYLEFNITNKSAQLQIPLTQLMGSAMPMIALGAGAGDQWTARSQYSGVWETPIEIVLSAKTNFNVDIVFTAAHNASLDGDFIYISLLGGLIRLQ